MVGELLGEAAMRLVVLGDDEQAAGVLVEPVDDAGPAHAADAGEALAAMGDEGVDQRAVLMAAGGVDDEAGGLVDDDQMLVLEDDGERDVLADRRGRLGLGHDEAEALADGDLAAGIGDHDPVDADAAFLDHLLEAGARDLAAEQSERLVEAQPRLLGRDDEFGGGRSSGLGGGHAPSIGVRKAKITRHARACPEPLRPEGTPISAFVS